MIFQIVDDKKECRGYFADGKLRLRELSNSLTATWDWSELIEDRDVLLAKILVTVNLYKTVVPTFERKIRSVERKIKSHLKSFISAKVNLSDICFYNLIPESITTTTKMNNRMGSQNNPKPNNYRLMHDVSIM